MSFSPHPSPILPRGRSLTPVCQGAPPAGLILLDQVPLQSNSGPPIASPSPLVAMATPLLPSPALSMASPLLLDPQPDGTGPLTCPLWPTASPSSPGSSTLPRTHSKTPSPVATDKLAVPVFSPPRTQSQTRSRSPTPLPGAKRKVDKDDGKESGLKKQKL
ncbi:hypothetical protein BYT27DRAFT_7262860 [Phlegmacium glaucopus]|nr:hypothetical protein BYT27DRAFT_7262860 [Phlegmacium glaucopus]